MHVCLGQANTVHHILLIPGLGDHSMILSWLAKRTFGNSFDVSVFPTKWKSRETFQEKLKRLRVVIDQLTKSGSVSLVGCSAGGSLAFNAFLVANKKVQKVVNVCGRLKEGSEKGTRSFASRTKGHPAFADSVRCFELKEIHLAQSSPLRTRMMTIRARYGDELVPVNTTSVLGATNISIPTIEHSLSIMAALSIFSGNISEFLI